MIAIQLGVSFPRLTEVIRGKRAVTPDTALLLAQVLGTTLEQQVLERLTQEGVPERRLGSQP